MSATRIVIPRVSILGEEIPLPPRADHHESHTEPEVEASFTLPGWFVVLLKVSAPAVACAAGMYVKVYMAEADIVELQQRNERQVLAITAAEKRCSDLERDVLKVQFKGDGLEKDLSQTFKRIESYMSTTDSKLEKINTSQQAIQTDVRVIQQKLGDRTP